MSDKPDITPLIEQFKGQQVSMKPYSGARGRQVTKIDENDPILQELTATAKEIGLTPIRTFIPGQQGDDFPLPGRLNVHVDSTGKITELRLDY